MDEYLDEKLKEYQYSNVYPFHMPGHKRRDLGLGEPSYMDITEIEGFDNLHHAEGIIKEAQERAAKLWHAKQSFFLVNGSSCGLLAAVCASVKRGGRILMARNCHKSVYNAVSIKELKTTYLYPVVTEFGIQGMIKKEDVERKLNEYPDVEAVLVTSPTYDGIVSDISAIAELVHAHGIPLIVDEAHGAHFGFHDYFPQSSIRNGADLVVQSLHKTLPSLTQTAVLHLTSDRISPAKVSRYLGIFETSSPSYVLMAGMDRLVRMLKEQGEELFSSYIKRLENFYQSVKDLGFIRILDKSMLSAEEAFAFDPSKIIISVKGTGLTGTKLSEILLEKYHLQMEMDSGFYVTAMTSIMDRDEGFMRLTQALHEIDGELAAKSCQEPETAAQQKTCAGLDFIREVYRENPKVMEITEAEESRLEPVPLLESEGCISGEFLYLYPPGIPILVPGEKITEPLLKKIAQIQAEGMNLCGLSDGENKRINIVKF